MKTSFLISIILIGIFLTSCRHVDNFESVEVIIKNQTGDNIILECRHYENAGKIAINNTIISNGESMIYGTKIGRKEYFKIENYRTLCLNFFGDSSRAIFSDGSYILYSVLDTTFTRNILYLQNYTQTDHATFVFTLTEADHQAAKAAGAR